VIDTSERKAVATLPSGPSPKRVAFSPDGQLVFVSYNLEPPKYNVEECRQRGTTFAAPIKVTTGTGEPQAKSDDELSMEEYAAKRSKRHYPAANESPKPRH